MREEAKATSNSTLFRIAGFGASMAFGAMIATLFAVRVRPAGVSFEFSPWVVIAFVIAAAVGWLYWRMVARLAAGGAAKDQKKKFQLFSVGLVLLGAVGFLFPLKFIPAEKRLDVFIGLSLALSCILGVGLVMWKVKRFLDADLKRSEDGESPQD
jgi:branched-subunit amino acid ABC-type transport system permease component